MANANDMDTVGQSRLKADNEYLRVIEKAEHDGWCLMLYCLTCYAHDFRSAVRNIGDLQTDLETLDLDLFTSHRKWSDALRITALDQWRQVNWGDVLMRWLPYAQDHPDFTDKIFYHIARRLPHSEIRSEWLSSCLDLAIRTKYPPLLESLIRILGPGAANHDNLLETALNLAPENRLLRNALAKAGFISSEEALRREEKRKMDGQKLLKAIGRKDIKAVRALMAKGADLKQTDESGRTPLEYAKFLGRNELVELIGSANAEN